MIPGTLLQFSYAELENATNKFSESNLIGMGGSSYVYCGHLKDGGTAAIKRMKAQEGPNAESDFLTEVLAQSAFNIRSFLFLVDNFEERLYCMLISYFMRTMFCVCAVRLNLYQDSIIVMWCLCLGSAQKIKENVSKGYWYSSTCPMEILEII